MPCTYNSGTDTITVTGYTSGTPCTFTDIYNADVAGGWGQVTRQCSDQFCFDAHLDIGDGSTVSWFADLNKTVIYPNAGTFIAIKENATFRIGEADNVAQKTSKNGCFLKETGGCQNMIGMYKDCKMEIYSSIIDVIGAYFFMYYQGTNPNKHRIWNTTWKGHSPSAQNGIADIDIYRVNIQAAVSGILSIGTQKDIHIEAGTTYGAFFAGMPDGEGIDGYVIDGCTYDILVYDCSNRTLYVDNSFSNLHGNDWIHIWSSSLNNPIVHRFDFELRTVDDTLVASPTVKTKVWNLSNVLVVNNSTNEDGYLGSDYGTADASTTTTLVDATKSWTVNEYKKYVVEITSGTGSGQIRGVISNTATALTITPAWTTTPDTTSKYYIAPIKLHRGTFPNTNIQTWETPHTMRIYKYGKLMQYSKFKVEEQINWLLTMNTDPYITQTNEATVAAYTGITINHTAETITISANHTLNEIYDYCQYDIIASTKQLDQTITTANGVAFISHYDFIINTGITVTCDNDRLTTITGKSYTLTGTAQFTGILADQTKQRVPLVFKSVADGSRYRIEAANDGSLIIDGTQAGSGDIRGHYERTSDVDILIKVRKSSGSPKYLPYKTPGTITDAVFQITASQQLDDIAT